MHYSFHKSLIFQLNQVPKCSITFDLFRGLAFPLQFSTSPSRRAAAAAAAAAAARNSLCNCEYFRSRMCFIRGQALL
jgi:hypothetical protein